MRGKRDENIKTFQNAASTPRVTRQGLINKLHLFRNNIDKLSQDEGEQLIIAVQRCPLSQSVQEFVIEIIHSHCRCYSGFCLGPAFICDLFYSHFVIFLGNMVFSFTVKLMTPSSTCLLNPLSLSSAFDQLLS